MPLYLVHGFRWPRTAIRIHIILNNIDDAAPEWIVGPDTSAALRDNLTDLYPAAMSALPNLRFVEQYDPRDDHGAHAISQPYAFVADKVEECTLSLDLGESMQQGVDSERWEALLNLKDKLAPKEKLGWYMVYTGDGRRTHCSLKGREDRELNGQASGTVMARTTTEQQRRRGELGQTQRQQVSNSSGES